MLVRNFAARISAILMVFYLVSFFGNCASAQKPDILPEKKDIVPVNKEMEQLFSAEPEEDEALRVYASSEHYELKQTGFDEKIEIIKDNSGRNPLTEEISQYDMVDMYTEAVYKVSISKDSKMLSQIRPVRPSKISELNKLIIDDITRIKFRFKDEENPENTTFTIRYGVKLQNKKSREEIKQILQENVRE